jgi:tetratricopeptide (TPR) repeat protein
MASYKSTLEADSNNTEILTSLKEDADKSVDKAVESYSRAIEINDKDWQAYKGLGVAYMLRALNDENKMLKAKAIYQWRLSLDINPDQPSRRMLLKLIEKYSK